MTTVDHQRLRGRWGKISVIALALLLVVGTLAVVLLQGRDTMSHPGYHLIWQDEFDGSDLDYFKWNAQDVASPRNNELQYYTPNNVRVDDGHLLLTSKREPFGGRSFTSAAVDTHDKFSFTYGKVEIRAQLPPMGQGVWPALWMLGAGCNPVGDPCPWPTPGSSEIDIMEAVNSPATLYHNLHVGYEVGRSTSTGPCERAVDDLSADFHTFAVDWEPGGVVRWHLDDELVCERSVPGFLDTPMYVFLNTAVGGDWPGPPDPDTLFPQIFTIDHVRIYRKD